VQLSCIKESSALGLIGAPRSPLETIDYQRYGEGEARLGRAGSEVAHFKMSLEKGFSSVGRMESPRRSGSGCRE
jgi:hypothetical protein